MLRVSGQGPSASVARVVPVSAGRTMVQAGPYATFYMIDEVLFPPTEEVDSIVTIISKPTGVGATVTKLVALASAPEMEPLVGSRACDDMG